MKKTFKLIPFINPQLDSTLSIEASGNWTGKHLELEYLCEGDLNNILFPTASHTPSNTHRKDNLWQHTCFEAFITWDDQPIYWELNYSPSGEWNFYRFDSYRKGQTLEERIQAISSLTTTSGAKISIDLAPILPNPKTVELRLGLSAVIEMKDRTKTYWAIRHRGPKPDFHLRESFELY